MAIDNAEMAAGFGALLELDQAQIDDLTALFDQWALGGARLATWSRIATDLNLFNNAAVSMVHDWYAGTATGGPNGNGMYPLMNSEGQVFLVPSPARIQADLATLEPKGTVPTVSDLPAEGEPGDLWVVVATGDAWGWSARDGQFNNLGRFQGEIGPSAKAVVIAAGLLPGNATDADFATWLANSQVAAVQTAVQPLVDTAEAARGDAIAARDAAAGSETAAEQAAAQAAADADATEADRLAVAAGKVDVAADRQAAQDAAATATAKAGEASGSAEDADVARLASEGARDASLAAQQASEAARDDAADQVAVAAGHAAAADASADAAAADAVQTDADRTATGADRVASEAAAGIATGKAEEASLSALAAQEAEGGAETARDAAQAAQEAAEAARDEAQQIAGGDFQPGDAMLSALAALNGTPGLIEQTGVDTVAKRTIGVGTASSVPDRAAADTRYRLLSALLAIADVEGLQAALDGRVTPAQLDTAIQNIIGMAPADLDTLKEIADRLVGAEDDYAALVLVIAEKASQADLDALADVVAGKASQGPVDALVAAVAAITVPTKATGAELRAATNDDKFLTPKSVADALSPPVGSVLAPDLSIPVQTITLTANSTLGAPTGGKNGTSGRIYVKKAANYTLAFNTAWRPYGSVPALTPGTNTVDCIVWDVDEAGVTGFGMLKGRG